MSLIKVFELETYDQYYEGSQLAEINSGEVTSHKSEFSSMGFLSSLDLYLTVKKVNS